MLPEFLIAVSSTLQLWLGGTAALPAQPVQVAQAAEHAVASSAMGDTDRAILAVRSSLKDRKRLVAEKSRLASRYETELQDIDRLKKRRASWRRDNEIKKKKRESQATALELGRLDRQVLQLDARLRKQRAALVRAIDRELRDRSVSTARRDQLVKMRKSARRGLHRNKKIVLPDYTIDPLADPEELEYQAERIAQTEKELARELSLLGKRAERFRKMAKLDEKRRRAREVGKWDDNRPRRTSVSTALAGGRDENGYTDTDGVQNEGGPSPAPPDEADPGDAGALGAGGDDYADPSVVLVDVVDSETIDVLRSAERSGSLTVKAKAAERAHGKVREQLERLQKLRRQIENRAKRLRR